MTDRAIEVTDLNAGYSGIPVVRGLNLNVDQGEVVVLLGPNGAGKTTTLLTISGILPVISGAITVLGEPLGRHRPYQIARRSVAHVPEDRSLFFSLTVEENLRLGVRRGKADIALALRYFPALEPLLPRRAGLLSGGEQQMLAMGRALMSRPRVLMVDEMSLGLAPIIVEKLLPVLRQVAVETGCAVLLVEQHVHLALEVADMAYVLAHGNLVLHGSCEQLRKRPDLLETSYLGEVAMQEVAE